MIFARLRILFDSRFHILYQYSMIFFVGLGLANVEEFYPKITFIIDNIFFMISSFIAIFAAITLNIERRAEKGDYAWNTIYNWLISAYTLITLKFLENTGEKIPVGICSCCGHRFGVFFHTFWNRIEIKSSCFLHEQQINPTCEYGKESECNIKDPNHIIEKPNCPLYHDIKRHGHLYREYIASLASYALSKRKHVIIWNHFLDQYDTTNEHLRGTISQLLHTDNITIKRTKDTTHIVIGKPKKRSRRQMVTLISEP